MKNKNTFYYIGSILVLIGTIMGISNIQYAFCFLGTGAITLFALRFISPVRSDNFKIRRLERMRFFASLLMLLATFYLYKENNAWVILLLIASIFEAVAAFRMPKE